MDEFVLTPQNSSILEAYDKDVLLFHPLMGESGIFSVGNLWLETPTLEPI